MSGFETLITQRSEALERLARAISLAGAGEHDLAVVTAQTACEVLIREVLSTLVELRVEDDDLRPWLLERVRSYSLNDDPTRDLWNRVTGSRIQGEEFWTEYKAHVARRHGIVHHGDKTTPEETEASLRAASALIAYVETASGVAPPPDSPE